MNTPILRPGRERGLILLVLAVTLGMILWQGFTWPTMICTGVLIVCILVPLVRRRPTR